MTGEAIKEARPHYSEDKWGQVRVSVALAFTEKGTQIFSDITGPENKSRFLAIVLDGKVLSAPRIQSHIPHGSAEITGSKNMKEAQSLALLINSGALPAPLKVLEEKVVGPGLGQDSIVAGTRATALAVLAVAVWMVLTYSLFGLFSVLGIAFNLCFLIAALVGLGATLTLPGLAGIALTVGMSVDANVLINERIKEELREGRGVLAAMKNGYQRAMRSIMDSNSTTFTGSLLLYAAGTGPVRGFAITMALGILLSLFTSVGLTRMLAQGWASWRNPKELWI